VNDSPKKSNSGLGAAAAVIGVLGLIGVFVGKAQGMPNVFQSYLLGYLMWLMPTLGFLGIVILVNLVRGRFGYPILGISQAGARLLPAMAILFLPILFFLPDVYPWARPDEVAQNPVLQLRVAFLNPMGFGIRAVIYFAVWVGIAFLLSSWSKRQDQSGESQWEGKRSSFAAGAAVAFVLTVTLAATDWVMSLEPHWYSTIFGLLLVAAQMLTALAIAVAYLAFAKNSKVAVLVKPKHFHDLGTLLFTLVVFWAYLAFSQFLIIWSADLPEEITYFADRNEGPWSAIGGAIVFLHFLAPFLILLSAKVKRTAAFVGGIAVFILVMRVVEMFWFVTPSLHREGPMLNWVDFAAILGVGGIWLFVLLWQYAKEPSPPVYALRQMEQEHA